MMNIKAYIISALGVLSIASIAGAQIDTRQASRDSQSDTRAAQAKKRIPAAAMKFRVAGWKNIKDTLYYEVYQRPKRGVNLRDPKNKKFAKLTISEMQQSSLYMGAPGKVVKFYKKVGSGEEAYYKAVANSGVKKENGKYIFLIFPKKQDGRFQVYVVPDGPNDSKFGSYQFHNLSGATLVGMMNKKKFKLSSKNRVATVQVSQTKSESYNFGLFSSVEGGRPNWVARNTYTSNPDKHLKLFIQKTVDVNGRAKIKLKGLVDFREKKPEKATNR